MFKLKKWRMAENINRIKFALCEKNVKAKGLAEQFQVDPATVSKRCTNTSQPDLHTLGSITLFSEVDIRRLLNPTYEQAISADPTIVYGVRNG